MWGTTSAHTWPNVVLSDWLSNVSLYPTCSLWQETVIVSGAIQWSSGWAVSDSLEQAFKGGQRLKRVLSEGTDVENRQTHNRLSYSWIQDNVSFELSASHTHIRCFMRHQSPHHSLHINTDPLTHWWVGDYSLNLQTSTHAQFRWVHWLTHSTNSLTHSHTHSVTHSPIQSHTHSPTHSTIHQLLIP